ncbi:MAG TPA: sugar kinase [Pilimelia sp.]|nr:sugar kinase [Pilimelia sp.]
MTVVDLLTLGETMVLLSSPRIGPLRHARSLDVGVGGSESNLAIGLVRLGRSATWVGRLGDDEFGHLIRSTLAGEGVDASHVIMDPAAPTGLMLKSRRTATVTAVHYYRTGSAGSRLRPGDVSPDLVRAARVLHVSAITPALSGTAREAVRAAVDEAVAAGVPVSLDLNYRRALWSPSEAGAEMRALAKQATVVFAAEDEARLVVEGDSPAALARGLAALGPREVVVKRGERGALGMVDGRAYEAPLFQVTAVDPVGAGDAFAAGYLSELFAGGDPAERLATGAAAGAFAVTVAGDWEGLPRPGELSLLRATDAVQR